MPMPMMRLRGNGDHPPPSHLRSMTPITQLFADLVVHASRNNRGDQAAASVSTLVPITCWQAFINVSL